MEKGGGEAASYLLKDLITGLKPSSQNGQQRGGSQKLQKGNQIQNHPSILAQRGGPRKTKLVAQREGHTKL